MDISTRKITSKKIRGCEVDCSTIEITSKKVPGNNMDFSTIKITWKKVSGNNVDFSTIEITLKKVCGNNVDFSTIEITSKEVCGNDGDFSMSEITSKKFVEMTRKFVQSWSSTYRRIIHVESTWIRRGVPVGLQLNILLTLINIRVSSFLDRYPEKKMGKDILGIISCTKTFQLLLYSSFSLK